MIKPNELRIGNLVVSNNHKYRPDILGKVLVVSGIDTNRPDGHFESGCSVSMHLLDDKYKDVISQWIEFILPIPLTEVWLERFGFEKRSNEYFFLTIEATEPQNKHYRQFALSLENGNFMSNMRKGLNVEHVHQLQNLYFALTGTELELKTEKA